MSRPVPPNLPRGPGSRDDVRSRRGPRRIGAESGSTVIWGFPRRSSSGGLAGVRWRGAVARICARRTSSIQWGTPRIWSSGRLLQTSPAPVRRPSQPPPGRLVMSSHRRSLSGMVFVVVVGLSACHHPPPAPAAPSFTKVDDDRAARERADALARADAARRDSIARADAIADSLRRAGDAARAADAARRALLEAVHFDFDEDAIRPARRACSTARWTSCGPIPGLTYASRGTPTNGDRTNTTSRWECGGRLSSSDI